MSAHEYLGELDSVLGRTWLEENSVFELPLFVLPGVVLFPGEDVPLLPRDTAAVQTINELLDGQMHITGKNIAVIWHTTSSYTRLDSAAQLIGTVAEVAYAKRDAGGDSGGEATSGSPRRVALIARGRQRFQLLRRFRRAHAGSAAGRGMQWAQVRICREEQLPPFGSMLCCSVQARRGLIMGRTGGTYSGARRRRRMTQAMCRWPAWVLDQFETSSQLRQLSRSLALRETSTSTGDGTGESEVCGDATATAPTKRVQATMLSLPATASVSSATYALCKRLAMSDCDRQRVLACESVNSRLRMALSYLKHQEPRAKSNHNTRTVELPALACAMCSQPLAILQHVFTVGGSGNGAGADASASSGAGINAGGTAYVNEHGYVHQTLTVRRVAERAFHYQGQPCSQHSWFPGWAWTIAQCSLCGSHLGWKFDSEDDGPESSHANVIHNMDSPPTFWGLSRSAVVPTTVRVRAPTTTETQEGMDLVSVGSGGSDSDDDGDGGVDSDSDIDSQSQRIVYMPAQHESTSSEARLLDHYG